MANDYKIIEKIRLDNLEFKDYLVKENAYSVLGQEFLSRHIVTFDFPNKIMYLKKGKNYNKQPNIYMPIGMKGCVVNSKDYVFEKVDPNSSAYKKGIRAKDILVKVNNENIQDMGITEFMKYLIEVPVTNEGKLPFTFKRGDETFTVEFIKKAGQK
jgi:membrane-associated protease RseP (regulator of RpoE activity)